MPSLRQIGIDDRCGTYITIAATSASYRYGGFIPRLAGPPLHAYETTGAEVPRVFMTGAVAATHLHR